MDGSVGGDEKPSGRRKWAKIGLKVVGGIVAAMLVLALFVYWKSERGMNQTMRVTVADLAIPDDAGALVAGERLAATTGCLECHGRDGAGKVVVRALPVIEVRTPNLTPAGPTASYSGRDWARAVRHGVRPDGTVLLFMPCRDFQNLSDADLGVVVAYLKSLPPVERDVGRTRVGPVGRALYVSGKLPLITAELIDQDRALPPAPPRGPTAAYGAYLANACTGCHGENLSGGPIPGVPPEWPPAANLTPDASGLGTATEAQFTASLTSGARRSGGTIDPTHMPWRQFARFTDDERHAIWMHLRELPPTRTGQH